mmetsp:Transcript_30878/g.56024  ORF Transcript_30878/g.56024 Transcript_30878/m.56024 type:complete len:169 (-) Transcript_30878:78-584(-)|eukprot:CAMPEP_0197650622 /NCGR_PEP_ID=MMETSP1338-20131121/31055_1 /TAXON_ID=43686 ORGANISM="Pelagodinium beii, Strain RCC1491" /NCGR_SAMPLE_ID=MMETSP1338 /ASSEMBLY_ACC=CAM_ASM_000754 /LENGTH=168 /DNA_ID=CAMNT_0043225061 /DNA_START=89 /DNA_END=595 /DNA_ORIENTATION=-
MSSTVDFNKFNSKKKLFFPAGPITARHTKKNEWLIPETQAVWSKSGPPMAEPRNQKGDVVPALLDPSDPSRKAAKACVEIRRDLNTLVKQKGGRTGAGLLLQPEVQPASLPTAEELEHPDDLWESLGYSSLTNGGQASFAESIAKLNKTRATDVSGESGVPVTDSTEA